MALRRSLAWMAFGQGVFFLLQFLGSIAIARLLTPYDVGIFSIAMAVVGLVSVLQALGLNSYIVREKELTPDLVATAAAVNATTAVILAIMIAGIGFAGAHIFREPGVRDVLLVVAIVPLIGHFAFVPSAMLEREGEFRTLALLKVASTAVGLVITIALALAGYRYMSFAYSQVAAAIVTNVALNIAARRHVTFRLSLSHWSSLSRFGVQIFAISGLNRMATRVMEIALGRITGLAALGLYTRASSNHTMLWDSIHSVVGRVAMVDFSRHSRAGSSLREPYLRVLEMMTALLWPVFAGCGILAGPLILTLYGEPWLGAAIPFALLCLASLVMVSTSMAWEVFVVSHETARQARLELVRTIFGIALFVAGCFHSLEAAAASRLVSALLGQMLYRPHLARMIGAAPSDFYRIYLRGAVAMTAAVAPALALMAQWRFSPRVPLLEAAAAVAIGVLLWLLTLRLLRHPLFDEMSRFVRRPGLAAVPAE